MSRQVPVCFALGLLSSIGFLMCESAHRARAQAPAANGYQVETSSSRVYIRVGSATRLGHNHGIQGTISSGTVTLGGTGELVFAVSSFVADTPEARQYVGLEPGFSRSDAKKVNENMRGPDCLDVGNYPTATCSLTSIRPLDGQAAGQTGRYQCDGRFTLHGVAQNVSFTATAQATDKDKVLRFRGSFSILQTSYGIQPYSALGGLIRVADALQIWGDLLLQPALH
jgi:hypothetical protein